MSQPSRVTQETFNEVVRENIDEFDMDVAEAIADAMEQFRMQHVDLSNIQTEGLEEQIRAGNENGEHGVSTVTHPVIAAARTIGEAAERDEASFDVESVRGAIDELYELCKDDEKAKTNRLLAAEHVVMPSLFRVAMRARDRRDTLTSCLQTMFVLCLPHAEHRSAAPEGALSLVVELLSEPPPALDDDEAWRLTNASLRLARALARQSESNKVALKEAGCLEKASAIAAAASVEADPAEQQGRAEIVLSWALMRSIFTKDDKSVTMSKTFEYAREWAAQEEPVAQVFQAMQQWRRDPLVVAEGCLLLKEAAVNDEVCRSLTRKRLLEEVWMPAAGHHLDDPAVGKSSLALLRALTRNDANKDIVCADVGEESPLRVVLTMVARQPSTSAVHEQAWQVIANVCLRAPHNAAAVVQAGVPAMIAHSLRTHVASPGVGRAAALAVRNIVSRDKTLISPFQREGIPDLIREVRVRHEACADPAYAALRDLDEELP